MNLSHFTDALRREMDRARINQSELGRKAGAAPAMLSAWLSGKTPNPEPQKVFAVERALDLQPGALSHHLGYVPYRDHDVIDLRSAIEADPKLNDLDREALRLLYNVFRRRSAASNTVSAEPASKARKSASRASR